MLSLSVYRVTVETYTEDGERWASEQRTVLAPSGADAADHLCRWMEGTPIESDAEEGDDDYFPPTKIARAVVESIEPIAIVDLVSDGARKGLL